MTNAVASPAAAVGLKEILVATDFSPAAQAGLSFAIELARKHDARLHLVHLVWMHSFDGSADVGLPVWDWRRRVGREQLDALDHSSVLAGLPHQAHLLQGVPELTLPEFVARRNIDLAVVGASGRGGLDRLVLGSTSEKILRALSCPVLTIGPAAWHTRHGSEFRGILAACGVGPSAEHVVQHASRLAEEYRAELTLLHVVPARRAGTASLYQAAERRLQALMPRDGCFWMPPEVRVEVGVPADSILSAAEQMKADLIVMGASAGGGLSDHESSVTHAIVCGARCPVLTLRD